MNLCIHPSHYSACPYYAYFFLQITSRSLASANGGLTGVFGSVCICCQLRPFILLNI